MIQLGQYVSIGLKRPTSIIQPYVRFINRHLFRGYMRGVFVEHNMSGMTPDMWKKSTEKGPQRLFMWGFGNEHRPFVFWSIVKSHKFNWNLAIWSWPTSHTYDFIQWDGEISLCVSSVGKPLVFPRFPYAIITSCIPAAVAALVVAGAGLKGSRG